MTNAVYTQLNPYVPERTAISPKLTAGMLCLEEGDNFIDIGFGNGEHAMYASSLVGAGRSVGIDSEGYNVNCANVSKNNIGMLSELFKKWEGTDMERIRQTAGKTVFRKGYAEELSAGLEEKFNKALLSRVLRWTTSEEHSLKEVFKIMEYGGKAVIIDNIDYSEIIKKAGFEIIEKGNIQGLPDCFYILRK